MKLINLIFLFLPICALAQTSTEKQFTLTGNVAGLPDSSMVTLSDLNNPDDTIGKAIVRNGSFIIKGSIPEPNLYHLNFNGAAKKTLLFLDNDDLQLHGDVSVLQEMKVSGSDIHDEFVKFQQTFNPLFQEIGRMSQLMNSSASQAQSDSLKKSLELQINNTKSAIAAFLQEHKSSEVGVFMLLVTSELEEDIQKLKSQYQQLDADIQQSFYGKILNAQIEDALVGVVGAPAIAFSQADTAGIQVSLDDFKGKCVLIDFWASWCGPCRQENPNVVHAFERFNDKNFTVLGISLDKDKGSWLEAIKEDELYWTQLSDLKFWSNEVAVKYRIQSIPQNFLISPDGIILAKNLRGPELHAKLCELLGGCGD